MKLRPLDDRVVIKQLDAEEKTSGGIILPDAAKEKPQIGKIVATGPGKLLEDGKRGKMSVKKNDEVIYGKFMGIENRSQSRSLPNPHFFRQVPTARNKSRTKRSFAVTLSDFAEARSRSVSVASSSHTSGAGKTGGGTASSIWPT